MNENINILSLSIWTWQWIMLVVIGLWVYSLSDIIRNQFENNVKIIWLLVVLFLPMVGPAFYLFLGRRKKIKSV